jgi:hypothetical protein
MKQSKSNHLGMHKPSEIGVELKPVTNVFICRLLSTIVYSNSTFFLIIILA